MICTISWSYSFTFHSVLPTNAEEAAINSMATLVKMLVEVQWPSFGAFGDHFFIFCIRTPFVHVIRMCLYECLNIDERLHYMVTDYVTGVRTTHET